MEFWAFDKNLISTIFKKTSQSLFWALLYPNSTQIFLNFFSEKTMFILRNFKIRERILIKRNSKQNWMKSIYYKRSCMPHYFIFFYLFFSSWFNFFFLIVIKCILDTLKLIVIFYITVRYKIYLRIYISHNCKTNTFFFSRWSIFSRKSKCPKISIAFMRKQRRQASHLS